MSANKFLHKPVKLSCWGCLCVGLLAAIVAVGLGMHTKSYIANCISTRGSVSEITSISVNSAGTPQYSYAFKFVTPDGQSHPVKSITSTNSKDYEIGQEVPVLYPKDDISAAEVKTTWQLWSTTVYASLAGLLCLCFAFLFCRLARKLRPAEPTE